ncbi:uncharacterized protein IL334_005341 [Kwoniella shivajii]|uniref:Transporter particle component n=1 Tax=Kwoniella shivajii TaxID=564305 RepID=A0ABZ1D2V8_9TREE|nr:hypothetical protein IL334_005341 [Kwoniella shivajii]
MSARPSTSSSHLPLPPSIPPALHFLANPAPVLIDSGLPNYLLPNVLNLLRDSSAHVIRKKKAQEDELREEGLIPPLEKGKGKGKEENEGNEERLIQDELNRKMEKIGLMVGGYIAEKLTLARPPLASQLDIIKFICKDLFLYVYSRQIDNLRTNHRGIFVLQSHTFPPLIPLSSCKGSSHDIEIAKNHLLFPQALIQGALVRLGMQAIVTAESSGLPQCTFQIRTIKAAVSTTPSTAGTPNPNPNPNSNPNSHQQSQGQGQGQSQNRPGSVVGGLSSNNEIRGSTGLGIGSAGI